MFEDEKNEKKRPNSKQISFVSFVVIVVESRNRESLLLSPHSERIRHAVDVVEPGSDQRDLQDPPIVEAG